MPRTLVFCTAFAEDPSVWNDRYRLWLDAIQASAIGADQVLIVDDGSATLPGWLDTRVISINSLGDAYSAPCAGPVLLAHFRTRLGRAGVLNFPGWHRSFAFAALYAERHAFDRVIHIESDAYVISARAQAFPAAVTDGWAAFWCARYDMPESAVQVAAGQGVRVLAGFARRPYGEMIGKPHEREMPFTAVEKQFRGDRMGEFADAVPADADYAAQVPSCREHGFYWFARGEAPPAATAPAVEWGFCNGGNGLVALRDGWSTPEDRHHWIDGADATLILPALGGTGDAVLRLRVTPHVFEDVLTRQRLIVEINGCRVREFVVRLEALLGCDIPASCLGRAEGDVLRLITPDAAAPSAISPQSRDGRRLSVSVERMHFSRL
jgi:hypothetical protein